MRMPTCLVLALMAMQPRLEGEESITAANRIAVGGGKLKTQDAARVTQAWQSAARPNGTKPKPDAGVIMAAGFAVRRVKVAKKK